VVELVDAISQGSLQQIPQIKGIVFRDGLKIVRTPPREYIEDLDTLPFPARHLFPPLSKYTRFYYKSSPLATIITSRGCPYQCTFCDRTVFGNRVRIRSIENVLDEIEMLVRDCGVREVNIVDDLFTMTPRRVEEFCHGLLSRKLKISWACFSRVDSVTPDILKTMKEAGCWMLGYGIESGNQRILDKIKKNVTLETIEKAVKWTRKMNIRTVGFFIFGLPGEDETSIRNTLRFANKLLLDRAAFSILLPLPGSELYKTTLTKGGIVQDTKYRYCGNLYLPEKLPYVAEGLSIDILREYRKKAYRDFYLRPAYIAKRFLVYHEFKGLLMRIKALIKVIF